MGFFKEKLDEEYNAGIKKRTPRVIYAKKRQTGKRLDFDADKKRKSLPPGLRVSKSGKKYYEYRKTRSDISGLNI